MSKAVKAVEAVETVAENAAEHVAEASDKVASVGKAAKIRKLGRFIPKVVSRNAGRTALVASKHSPTLLFAAGVVGVVGTAVLASKATLRLEDVLEEHNANKEKAKQALDLNLDNYTTRDYNKDLTILYIRVATNVVKLYGPTILLGAATVAALAGSHNILSRRNAGLTAAYAALDKGFSDYRKRVSDEFGEDKERELRYSTRDHAVVEETTNKDGKTSSKAKNTKRVGPHGASIYAKFFDEYTKNWKTDPQMNLFFIKCQQTYANDMLRARGHVFLNEVYDMLGFERTKAGQVVGWVLSPEGDNYIDFGVFDGDSERARAFVNGHEGSILLDFNVDGLVYDKI